jgi:hypothetical protein
MSGVQSGEETPVRSREGGSFASARRSVQQRVSPRVAFLTAGAILVFLLVVGLVMYFKPGSTAEPTGEPSLDIFAAGPIEEFEAGMMTLFEKEHIFLVRMEDGGVIALYDLGPHIQARIAAGDEEAADCRAVIREDEEMAGWLAATGAPAGFGDRGIWDECGGVAWDASGQQVWGPESGSLDRFTVEIIDGIIRVNLGDRRCANPVTPQTPCIETQ